MGTTKLIVGDCTITVERPDPPPHVPVEVLVSTLREQERVNFKRLVGLVYNAAEGHDLAGFDFEGIYAAVAAERQEVALLRQNFRRLVAQVCYTDDCAEIASALTGGEGFEKTLDRCRSQHNTIASLRSEISGLRAQLHAAERTVKRRKRGTRRPLTRKPT